MTDPSSSDPRAICVPCRAAAIVAVVGLLAGGFAYAAGWLTPQRLSTNTVIDTFESNGGIHEGFRRNHAKGLCVDGYFESNGGAASLSKALVFVPGRTPVTGRFAIPGPNPTASDNSVPIRSMALMFTLADGQQWRTGMNTTPLFAVRTPEEFYAQLDASRPDPSTGKPDQAKLQAFFAAHPDTQPFRDWVKGHPPSSSYANAAYYGINAFYFVDANGQRTAVRWSMQPELPFDTVTDKEKGDANYLASELYARLKQGPVRWHLVVTIADPGDPTDDATRQWPATRKQIDAGTLVLSQAASQDDGACRDVNFDPTILPAGIEPSGDPLLAARSAAYALSYKRRTREEALNGAPDAPQGNTTQEARSR
ncbi:catalase [Pandoraea aquatica]|uniref:Catalase-related peroxidase n=1 Tax=Pandoraea aquatica TaxID=2508290 RepID=A0A5E4T262_9BURK|nr:catalase [Pandoraea aquatica]